MGRRKAPATHVKDDSDDAADRCNETSASASKPVSLYSILGLEPDASIDQVKKAYRKLVLECHPDKVGPSGMERFQEIQRVYEILSDPEKKKNYDEYGISDENSLDFDLEALLEYIRSLKRVTDEDLNAYEAVQEKNRSSSGSLVSAQEDEDIRQGYAQCKGDVRRMLREVIGFEAHTRQRFEEHISHLISQQSLEDLEMFWKTAKFAKKSGTSHGAGGGGATHAAPPDEAEGPGKKKQQPAPKKRKT